MTSQEEDAEKNQEAHPHQRSPGNNRSLPFKLRQLLADKSVQDIVRWDSRGVQVGIISVAKFESTVMGKYFPKTRFASFVRNMNRWGFRRVPPEPDFLRGTVCYFNIDFQRDTPMKRPRKLAVSQMRERFRGTEQLSISRSAVPASLQWQPEPSSLLHEQQKQSPHPDNAQFPPLLEATAAFLRTGESGNSNVPLQGPSPSGALPLNFISSNPTATELTANMLLRRQHNERQLRTGQELLLADTFDLRRRQQEPHQQQPLVVAALRQQEQQQQQQQQLADFFLGSTSQGAGPSTVASANMSLAAVLLAQEEKNRQEQKFWERNEEAAMIAETLRQRHQVEQLREISHQQGTTNSLWPGASLPLPASGEESPYAEEEQQRKRRQRKSRDGKRL